MLHKIDPTEWKILITAAFTTAAFDMDLVLRFMAPLLSAVVWFYLKPQLIKWHNKRK